MKEIRVELTWRGHEIIDVPDDWEWDGEFESLLEFSDFTASALELVDWTVNGR